MAEKLVTKNDLLNKLRAYNNTPDDEGLAACRELGGKLA